MTNTRLYFAYADNMNEEIVREICPGVSFEGVAELKNQRLTFNSQGKITITEDGTHSIWGIVWCLSTRDIHLLDEKEVETLGTFKKVSKHVNFLDGRSAEAFLYITDVGDRPSYSQSLIDFIIEQAQYWSLPTSYIGFLEELQGQYS
ncbi:MAG: gamma-glutamylcyclotransferase [Candidatus Marinimicrobia bacterium]|nr:gamma-glutamylcyclotransferase [Candidatus Neomarinimicrobiota bacterium]MBL7066708.1 gamma-glutamylcyclotransferase [Candidatus Neomarinimicrobiota bacterium]